MEFVTPFITPIVEYLMVPVKKHLGFFFSSTKHFTNMNERFQELNETKHEIEEKKKDASINDRVTPDRVHGWLEQVKTINEEARSIPTGGNGCLNLKIRYKAGKRSVNIMEKIDKLLEKQKEIEWTDKQRPPGMVTSHSGPSTSETVHDYDVTQSIFPSRKSIIVKVLESLEQDGETRMALCGMGGVGKTTMMEEIKKALQKRGTFHWVVRVVIGKKDDPIAIQQAFVEQMGEDLTKLITKEARADRLGKRFEGISEDGKKKILVILDDVWETINFKDIGLTSPFPNGFKLLVTSRDEKVCLKMGIERSSIFKIDCLEDADAESFFWKTVELSHGDDGELRKIGEDILKKCGGLPIAIETIASALRGENKDAWEVAWKSLQRHNLKDIESVVNTVFNISYDYLKKDDDKEIFVLCGLFPDDFDIVVEELLRYGWGLQFFKKADSLDEARKRTNTSVNNLIRANLLTESYTLGCVKMHDLARSFVLGNISKFKQASIVNHGDKSEWPTQDTQESCERLLLTCQGLSEFPQDFYYPNLAFLKLMNGDELLKFPKDFHKQMEKLEVMAYDKMLNPLHLVQLQCSSNLRTLCLDSCSLVDNDISFLRDLVNLEVLSVAYCGIQKLPSTITKLKRLKLLNLTGCVNLYIDDDVFQNLKKLEELYMRVSEKKPIRFTDANCDGLKMLSEKLIALELEFFENILQPKNLSLKTLQRFRISIGCSLKETKYSFKNTLCLTTNKSDLLKSEINELFSKTEELQLSVKDMGYVEDILMSPSQNSTFSKLKVLHVFNCIDLTSLFTIAMANGLKQLESLKVSSCPVLKSLVRLSNSVNVMELPQLVELELYDLPDFTSIIPHNDISATQPLFNKEVVFPKLSKLKVDCLKKLKQIWACDITSGEEENVSMLREIKVVNCDCLVNIFPRNPMRLLSHLEELRVKGCCSIEVLFNINLDQIEKNRSSSLRRIKCKNLERLTEVWRINEESNSGNLIRGFQSVETIKIKFCEKFRNVFTPTTVNFDIGALMNINIWFDTKITDIEKDDGNMSLVAYPFHHLTHTFHQFRNINFRGFKGAEVMFEMKCPSINKELITTQQQQSLPLLPCLEELTLYDMDALSHVWKCQNWNKFFILHKHQPLSSFKNLTIIYVLKCNSLKYLFSPLMSKLLFSLKIIYIEFCEGMEEVVSNRDDDEEDEVLTTSSITLFPCLDLLVLDGLDNLKQIGGVLAKRKNNVIHDQLKFSQMGVVSWSLCQYSTNINIRNCRALSSVIPSYAATQMQKLQNLVIQNCRSMVEVFEIKEINNNGCISSNFEQGSIPLPSSKYITMRHELTNLKRLAIWECDLLEYVFTFSTFESLKNLEELRIEDCKAMKVIVREENGKESSKVVLSRLKSIQLDDLPNLVGFFLGKNVDFEWSSLDDVMIKHCPKMIVFTPRASNLKYIRTWLGKHNLQCGLNFHHQTPSPSPDNSSLCPGIAPWSFRNLIEMYVEGNDELKRIVPYNELPHLQNLEKVHVEWCEKVDEVFEVVSEVTNNESQTVVLFPKLKEVELEFLVNLKYIWKSNQWRRLEFPHLTKITILGCHSIEYVFTPSMVGALMQLQELHIKYCRGMEVIVEKEVECDGKVSEILLPYLQSLNLGYLPRLKGVCLGKDNFTLSSLNTLVIEECPEIRIFTEGRSIAPELKLVKTSFGLFHVGEDINSFIMTKNQEGNTFGETVSPSNEDK